MCRIDKHESIWVSLVHLSIHLSARLSSYLSLIARTSTPSSPPFLSHLDFPAAARIFSIFLSFFVTPSSRYIYILTLPFSATLIFLCRPLRQNPPPLRPAPPPTTIRQRIKAACVRRYLRPTTSTRLLISSRGSKNTPLRPCVLSRARRGHRGYPSAGVATWVIRG